jgi:hypothetical protein
MFIIISTDPAAREVYCDIYDRLYLGQCPACPSTVAQREADALEFARFVKDHTQSASMLERAKRFLEGSSHGSR